jgi:hypothetical protein
MWQKKLLCVVFLSDEGRYHGPRSKARMRKCQKIKSDSESNEGAICNQTKIKSKDKSEKSRPQAFVKAVRPVSNKIKPLIKLFKKKH